jgi:hypothetical protein
MAEEKLLCPDSLVLEISLQILLPSECIVESKCHIFPHRCYFRLSHGQQGVDVACIFLFAPWHPGAQQSFPGLHYLHNNRADLIF